MTPRRSRTYDTGLLLSALRRGEAKFYAPTGEFCINGLRYSTAGLDWSRLCDVIGREQLEAAIAKEEGKP